MSNSIKHQKQHLRQVFRQKRKKLSKAQQVINAIRLSTFLSQSVLKTLKNKRITLYVATQSELDVYRIARWLKARGNILFLPIVENKDAPLVFRRAPIYHWRLLPKQHFNIPEPTHRRDFKASQLEIMLIPLLAFDSLKRRLGMGGGFYDRTLGQSAGEGHLPITIGVGYDFQQYKEGLPIDDNDYVLDAMITPTKLII